MPRIEADSVAAHRALVWSRVLDAFGAAVAEHGYAGVSLADIARRAGIARNSLYNYVPDKDALLLAHVDRSVARLLDDLADAGPPVSADDRLRALVGEHLDRVVHPRAGLESEAYLEDIGPSLPLALRLDLRQRFRPITDHVADILRDGMATGEFRPLDDVDLTVELITGLIAAARGAIRGGGDHAAVVESTRELVSRALGAR